MALTDILRFRCLSCGREYAVDPAKLPASGAKGPCKQCGEELVVHPDGRLDGAVRLGQQAPPAEASGSAPPAPSGAATFQCPSCGHFHNVDLRKIPNRGAKGRCARCHSPVVVMPDGSVSSDGPASEPLRAAPQEATAVWEVEMDGQATGPFSQEDIRQLIREGGLPPERRVRPAGGEWAVVSTVAVFAPLFAQGDHPQESDAFGTEDQCFAHPNALPTHQCSQCKRFLCEACTKESTVRVGMKPMKVCGVCGGLTAEVKRRECWTPFYKDLGQVFASPLRGHALLYFVILSLAELMKIPAAFGMLMGTMAIVILFIFQMSFYLHLIREVANGSYEFPEWPEMDDVWGMATSVIKVIFVTIYSLFPVILIGLATGAGMVGMLAGGAGAKNAAAVMVGPMILVFLFTAILYAFYLPICITIVAVFDTVIPALNPVLIVRVIWRIGGPYVAAVALIIAMKVIQRVLAALAPAIPFAGVAVASVIGIYVTLVSCYILGRVVYENEEKIGWH